MKKKNILFIILAILVVIYLIINILYLTMGLKENECCLCEKYYDNKKTNSLDIFTSAPAVCCDCKYNVFEKLSLILNKN